MTFISEDTNKKWRPVHGIMTPGGDPAWECPVCGEGFHVFGIECPQSERHECPVCGAKLDYE